MTKNRGVGASISVNFERKIVMKKVISIVLAIALVLSMSVCAFAAIKPTGNPAPARDMGAYYAALLNEGATKDEIFNEVVTDLEEGRVLASSLESVAEAFIGSANDQALAYEIVMELTAYLQTTTTTTETTTEASGGIGDIIGGAGDAIGGVVDGAGDVIGGVVDDASGVVDDVVSGADSFLDTILGVLGGLGDILFGEGGTGDGSGDANDDLWDDEESTTNSGDSQVPNGGDTTVVAVATVAIVAGAALVLTRKKSEDAE